MASNTAILKIQIDADKATASVGKLEVGIDELVSSTQTLDEFIDELNEKLQENANYAEGSMKALQAEKRALETLRDSVAQNSTEYQEFNQRIEAITLDMKTLKSQQDTLTTGTKQLSSTAGKTGATLTEFGRVIADSPYGIMGVANNIEQLSQQFVDLQREEGSTRAALKKLASGLIGPNGIVIAIQLATAAMVYFSRQTQKAKEEADNFNLSLEEQKRRLIEVKRQLELNAMTEEQRARMIEIQAKLGKEIAEADRRGLITQAELNKLLTNQQIINDNNIKLQEEQKDVEEKITENKAKQAKLLAEEIEANSNIAKFKEKLSNLDSKQVGYLQAKEGYENEITRWTNIQQNRKTQIADLEAENNKILDSRLVNQNNIALAETQIGEAKKKYGEMVAAQNEEEAKAIKTNRDLNDQRLETNARNQERLKILAIQAIDEEEARELKMLEHKYKKELDQAKIIGADITLIDQAYEEEKSQTKAKFAKKRTAEEKKEAEAIAKLQKKLDEAKNKDDLKYYEDAIVKQQEVVDSYKDGTKEKIEAEIELQRLKDKHYSIEQKQLKDAAKEIADHNKKLIADLQARTDAMVSAFQNVANLVQELGNIAQARFERELNNIQQQSEQVKYAYDQEREAIQSNASLSKEEKAALLAQEKKATEDQLTAIQAKENRIRQEKIKAEQKYFAIQQAMILSTMILETKMQLQSLMISASKSTADAKFSLGEYMRQLGPVGVVAFAASIGGVLASIVSARRQAQAEIAGLSNVPVSLGGSAGGGSAAPATPIFNVVGASQTSQLAQTIASAEDRVVRAYVVPSDVTTAQQLERNIIEGASI